MKAKTFLILLSLAVASVASAQSGSAPQKIAEQRIYGDALGEVKATVLTGRKKYFYTADGKLSRVVNEKRGVASEPFLTTDYLRYNYAGERLSDVEQWQYTLGEGEQWVMVRSASGNVVYKYDDNGNCISESDGDVVTLYEYNAEGHCTKKVEGSGRTIVYDELNALGQPLHAIVRPAREQYLGDSYEALYTYDGEGNLISIYRQHDEDLKVEIGRIGTYVMYDEVYAGDFINEETWTYAGGKLTAHTFYGIDYSGMYDKAPESRTIYRHTGDGNEIVSYHEESYDSWTAKWTADTKLLFEDEYRSLSPATVCNVDTAYLVNDSTVHLRVTSQPQSLTTSEPQDLTTSRPQNLRTSEPNNLITLENLTLYRNGERITPTLVATDEDGALILSDDKAKLGDNEYFAVMEGSMMVGSSTCVTVVEKPLLPGDANDDGALDVFDVVLISEYILNPDILINMSAADCNADGNIDVNDIVTIATTILNRE